MKDKEIDFSEVVTKAMRFAFANLGSSTNSVGESNLTPN